MSKVNMKELVRNAPEGATYYRVETHCYYKIDHDDISFYSRNNGGEWVDSCCNYTQMAFEFIKLDFSVNIDDMAKEDGVTLKPVYTQEMSAKGELPPVGCTCEALEINEQGNNWLLIEVFAHHNNTAHFYMPNENDYGHSEGVNGNFRPIDNRTTEQKQLDHVTHLVSSMSHLPASMTGEAIIGYLKG